MGQRNMLCSNQMLDLEMDQQGQGHLPPEPCFLLGNISNFPHPNAHQVLVASGNTSNHEFHHVTGHPESNFFQYNCIQHHCPVANVDMGIGSPSGFYNPYMMHSSATRMYPVSLNHSSSNHLPSSSHPGQFGVSIDDYERNNHFMDYVSRSSGKRKNAEGVPGNYLNLNGSASSSSSSTATQLNTIPHQWEEQSESGTAILDVAPFLPPDYRSNGPGLQTVTEGASERSVRSRSSTIGLQVDSALAHNQNHLVQGNYMGQSFQPAASGWVEQQFMSNGSDGVTSIWNHSPDVPYLHGRNVNGGPLEIMSMGGQGYQDMTSSRNAAVLFHSPSMHHQYHHHLQHHHHHPSPPVQAMQGQNYNYHTQVPIPSYRHPTSNPLQHGPLNPSRDSVETVPRHSRPLPSNGLRMYRPHRSGGHHTTSESRNHPHLRFLSAEEIAILEIPGFYEVGNSSDQHREMRLDIDDMSYEELLALGEQIGSVKTGLSEETILRQLKTRMHVSSATYLPLDKSDDMDWETGTCIICQVEYQNQEKIGTLDCGHEYHADCIKQWLLVKNVCPICKTSALTGDEMDE